MSQEDKVIQFLQEGNSITSLDAFRFWGITRISAHIHSLRKAGFDIIREDIKVKDRNGKRATIGRWALEGEKVNDYSQMEMSL
tara:strand:+ start:400 stop:648 length:249 start_codon:yes stop_codon:yes gene_type:complete